MKKLLFLTIFIIFLMAVNFSFAQEDNSTLTISQNDTDEIISHVDEPSKTAIQTIKMNGVTNRYNGAISYSATFYDALGNPVKDQNVWFTLDTKSIDYGYDVKTDSNGQALLTIEVNNGNHYLTAFNLVTGTNTSADFKVFDVITAKNVKMYDNDGTSYKVRVFDENVPVKAGEKVTFTVSNKKYVKTTDKNGYASLKITYKPGIYYIYAEYKDFTTVNDITVRPVIKSLTSFSSRAVKSTIKYKVKYLGKNKKNKKIKVKFNKKTYKAKTNKKGIATFSLKTPKKVGSYKVVATYSKSKITSIYYKYYV